MLYLYALERPKTIESDKFRYFMNIISGERQVKISRLLRYEDKLRSLFAEVLLRYVLNQELGINNGQLEFSYNQYGKPELSGREDVFFNLSHSGNWILCGVGNAAIGVDVEVLSEPDLNIAKRFYTWEEYQSILSSAKEEQTRLFYSYWTLKESYVKLVGKGLSIPLDSFSFRLGPQTIIISINGKAVDHISFRIFETDERHISAVGFSGEKEELDRAVLHRITCEELINRG